MQICDGSWIRQRAYRWVARGTVVALAAMLLAAPARAQTMNVVLDSEVESGVDNRDGSRVRMTGQSHAYVDGLGLLQNVPLTPQGAGANRGNEGFFEASSQFGMTLTFDVPNAAVTHIEFTGLSPTGAPVVFDNRTTGEWLPGTWDPNAEQFLATDANDPNQEQGDFGLRLSSFLDVALRGVESTFTSGQLAVTGGTFNGAVGMRITEATLDTEGLTTEHLPLDEIMFEFEVNPSLSPPTALNYPSNLIWREFTGLDGNGVPTFGALTDPFPATDPTREDPTWYIEDIDPNGNLTFVDPNSTYNHDEPADPNGVTPEISVIGRPAAVVLFDANGGLIPQVFDNGSTVASVFTDTLSGANDQFIDLNLEIDFDVADAFFLGQVLTEFGWEGDFAGSAGSGSDGSSQPFDNGNGLFASATIKVPGDGNGDGEVDIGDFTLWGGAFTSQDPNGDFNGDGTVDIGDFTQWGSFFGWGSNLPGPAPEPSSALLLAAGATGLLAVRRRRQR